MSQAPVYIQGQLCLKYYMLLLGTSHFEAAKLVNSPAVNHNLETASRDTLEDNDINICHVFRQSTSKSVSKSTYIH